MKKTQQLTFETILEDSFKAYEKRILAYMEVNAKRYLSFAEAIKPNLKSKEDIFSRIAFAILSANSPFSDTVKALEVVTKNQGKVTASMISPFKMVPAKALYLNRAFLQIASKAWKPKQSPSNWQEYRMEVKEKFLGLHYAKASFAVAMLHPTTANVACIDTWMEKVFLGYTGFKQLDLKTYLAVEEKIASYARKFNVCTFIAQWLIWDYARGGQANSHDVFPGNHKDRNDDIDVLAA